MSESLSFPVGIFTREACRDTKGKYIWFFDGAALLRNGVPKPPGIGGSASPDTIKAMSIPLFFDYWGVRLNSHKADGKKISRNWKFTNTGEQYALNLQNPARPITRTGRRPMPTLP